MLEEATNSDKEINPSYLEVAKKFQNNDIGVPPSLHPKCHLFDNPEAHVKYLDQSKKFINLEVELYEKIEQG